MPAVKTQPVRGTVDLTRKTPWRTLYRIVRAEVAGIKPTEGGTWATICLEHKTHVLKASLREACLAGTKGSVAVWCAKCKPLAAAPKPEKATIAAAVEVAEAKPAPARRTTKKVAVQPEAPAAKTTTRRRTATKKATAVEQPAETKENVA